MARKLIICCDDTWNEPEVYGYPKQKISNTLKLTQAILPINPQDGSSQIIHYDNRIGSDKRMYTLPGLVPGSGIASSIQEAYRFLANNYTPDDQIFCFGFSRGAYTVRSLCGLLSTVGLLPKKELYRLPYAYRYYQSSQDKRNQNKHSDFLSFNHDSIDSQIVPKIHFLGVWDSVGALGIPAPIRNRISGKFGLRYHDTRICDNVENAYQAIAIDEQRSTYQPDLWTDAGNAKEVMQVWFSGSHGNIGGGYPDSGLSDITLNWMVKLAQNHGLAFERGYLEEELEQNYKGQIYDSYSSLYRTLEHLHLKPFIRKPLEPIYGINGEQYACEEYIHPSVINRWHDSSAYYRPDNLNEKLLAHIPVYQSASSDKNKIQDTPALKRERRNSNRTSLNDVTGTIAINGDSYQCNILDIAKNSGLRVYAETLMPAGCDITINSAYTGPLHGRVVWTCDHQAGIRIAA